MARDWRRLACLAALAAAAVQLASVLAAAVSPGGKQAAAQLASFTQTNSYDVGLAHYNECRNPSVVYTLSRQCGAFNEHRRSWTR